MSEKTYKMYDVEITELIRQVAREEIGNTPDYKNYIMDGGQSILKSTFKQVPELKMNHGDGIGDTNLTIGI